MRNVNMAFLILCIIVLLIAGYMYHHALTATQNGDGTREIANTAAFLGLGSFILTLLYNSIKYVVEQKENLNLDVIFDLDENANVPNLSLDVYNNGKVPVYIKAIWLKTGTASSKLTATVTGVGAALYTIKKSLVLLPNQLISFRHQPSSLDSSPAESLKSSTIELVTSRGKVMVISYDKIRKAIEGYNSNTNGD